MSEGASYICVALAGEIDLYERERLDAVLDVTERPAVVILDLARTSYLDSSALGAFVSLRERLIDSAGSEVIFAGAGKQVARLFEICGFDQVFARFDSVDAALQHLRVDQGDVERRRLESNPPS